MPKYNLRHSKSIKERSRHWKIPFTACLYQSRCMNNIYKELNTKTTKKLGKVIVKQMQKVGALPQFSNV